MLKFINVPLMLLTSTALYAQTLPQNINDVDLQRLAYLEQGETKYNRQCVACHGTKANGGLGPSLLEKNEDYLSDRLRTYRAGQTAGERSAMMWGQAASLTDRDIQELVKYIVSLNL